MMLRRAASRARLLHDGPGQLPQVLEEAIDHIQPRARAELETFFAPGGPHATFRIRIEEGCIGGAFPVYDWKKLYVPVDAKWGLESLIAARLHQSKWFDKDADTSLVAFRPHTGERVIAHAVPDQARARKSWKTVLVRGGDGPRPVLRRRPAPGPRPLNHHFLVASGERRRGAWLFREHNAKHAWRAPATRDTAPRLRCFDPSTDVALPPPAFLRGFRPVWKIRDSVAPPSSRHDYGESIASMAWGA